MATNDYIPENDANALLWFQSFRDGISANPALYLLVAADATTIANVVGAFQTTLGIASTPGTRTSQTVANKDDARAAAETLCRGYAMDIKNSDGVTDGDKLAIGVRPVNPDRSPILAPTTSPALEVVAATPGAHTLQYSDPINPGKKAKPFGAANLQLFVGVAAADVIITDPTATQFYGAFTTTPVGVQFAASENGMQATYYARWAAKDGTFGPWSAPATLAIAA